MHLRAHRLLSLSPLLLLALVAGVLPSGTAGASAGECSGLGCEDWVATYDGPAHQLDTPRNSGFAGPVQSVALSPDGSQVFVTGGSSGGFPSEGGTGYDYATVAYDAATGDERWAARYLGVAPDDSAWASAITASPDGDRVFVTGNVTRPSPVNWNIDTVAYDAATGEQLWSVRYDTSIVDRAWSIGLAPDGSTLYVVGESRPEGKVTPDILTVAYDAATGAQRWAARYDGPAGDRDEGRWLAVAPDGSSVFVTGRSLGSGTSFDYATVAYDAATGAQRWVSRYNGLTNGWDEPTALAASSEGSRVFVTGQSAGLGTSSDYATVAYDATTGAQGWESRYNGPGNSVDIAQAVAVDRDASHVVITGYSLGAATSYDFGTVAYDAATGDERWVARYNGPPGNNSDNAYAVAFSPNDAFVYVTGESPNDTHYDVATVGYEASNGSQRGVARYNGPENFQDAGFGLAIDPDGSRVYVNGESWHNTSPGVGDYVTLAYDASALSGQPAGPVVRITDGPAAATTATTASFSFSASKPASFACSVDAAPFAGCSSPAAYSGLGEGTHTFSVRATDAAGNTGPEATWDWTVDLTAPDTTIDSGPEGETGSTQATFSFRATESWTDFACRLDSNAWEPCTSPMEYSGLSAGPHTFEVRGTDAAGNTDPTPASRAWAVDTTLPDTTITSGPSGLTTSSSASFGFSSSEAGSTFECSLDGSAFSACTSPKSYPLVSDGSHTFRVRAVDAAGNVDPTPAQRTWTVDAFGPQITILRPTAGIYRNDEAILENGPQIVVVGYVTVKARAQDDQSGVAALGFEVNGTPVDPSKVTLQDGVYRFTFEPESMDEHTITARATNGSGHPSALTIRVFGIPGE